MRPLLPCHRIKRPAHDLCRAMHSMTVSGLAMMSPPDRTRYEVGRRDSLSVSRSSIFLSYFRLLRFLRSAVSGTDFLPWGRKLMRA